MATCQWTADLSDLGLMVAVDLCWGGGAIKCPSFKAKWTWGSLHPAPGWLCAHGQLTHLI
jgi:hypothetical protein